MGKAVAKAMTKARATGKVKVKVKGKDKVRARARARARVKVLARGEAASRRGSPMSTVVRSSPISASNSPRAIVRRAWPGLAKKNNGCQPPGQARQWAVGQPLRSGLGYALPADLLRRLSPPAGYTYMRVGSDILMIAVGTGLVVAGLQDLLR